VQRRNLLLTAVVLGLGGCAGAGTPGGQAVPEAPIGPAEPMGRLDPAVLEGWRDFPIAREPRPIVLLDEVPKQVGFATDEGKLAAIAGRYELATALPPAPPARLTVNLPDGPAELPSSTAEEALRRMRAAPQQDKADPNAAPLKITKIELGTAAFRTDRGEVRLPAWLFSAADALGPMAVPALGADAFWQPAAGQRLTAALGGERAAVSADGRDVTVTLPAPPEPCAGDPPLRYEAVAVESATAVAVGVRAVPAGARPGDCVRTMILKTQPYQVQLQRPLGGRVLLDGAGAVFGVTKGG